MPKKDESNQISGLVSLEEDQIAVAYKKANDFSPSEIISQERGEDLMIGFTETEQRHTEGLLENKETAQKRIEKEGKVKSEKNPPKELRDFTKMYLFEIKANPLLTREEEAGIGGKLND